MVTVPAMLPADLVVQVARWQHHPAVAHYLVRLIEAIEHPDPPAGRLLPVHECNQRTMRSRHYLEPRLRALLDKLDQQSGPCQLEFLV